MKEIDLDDLQAAAFVLAKGYPLVRTDGPPYRKTFIFQDVPEHVLVGFYSGQAEVNAKGLFEAYRTLRAIARQALQERNRNRNYATTTHATSS
jgi:hypothetical protein